MKCVLLGIVAVIGLFALSESLDCNKCRFGLVGLCLIPSTETCSSNSSVCLTAKATFTDLSSFLGFNLQGCAESTECNNTVGNLLGAAYTIERSCCSTDKCNPLTTSSASYVQLSLTALLSATLFACVWGQSVY